ncbi:hypothetical protein CL617_03645 [archaeon]|nr:hypothetical protein [archaeon]|tara:strand:+ start:303 stop:815 length:513 start_codon:yes stop_codon:yes gene_type:complete
MKTLDLGCGHHKVKGAFGVDFIKLPGVDFVWDLNKTLPKEFHNEYDVVYSNGVIDHLGNPLNFLEGCKKYLKKDGKLITIVDNGDYWRYHLHLGNYHADLWEKDFPDHPETHHKMLFQMKHIEKILKLLDFKVTNKKYIRLTGTWKDYHIDYLLPKFIGCNFMKIEAIKN